MDLKPSHAIPHTVNVNGKVDGIVPNNIQSPLNDPIHTNVINLASLDAVEAHNLGINLIVLQPKQLRPETTVNARTFIDAAFATSVPKERTVCDGRLLRGNARVALIRIPGIQMRVQMDHRDRAIDTLE